ncbi:MAG: FCD domain-containing protein [Spirochaetes bacterium]|nr:FCD domain-containing protein [Spirochaetota bacterium]
MEHIRKNSTVDMASDQIVEYLQSDAIQLGDKLPSEKAMCDIMHISRTTIREAYRKLQSLGYLDIVNGKGAFVKSKDHDIIQESINSLRSNKALINDYLEVRKALDPLAAKLASVYRTREGIAILQKLHSEFLEAYAADDSKAMAKIDASIHLAIVTMTKNDLLIALTKVINFYFENLREKSFLNKHDATNAIGPHERIIAAISRGDSNTASQESLKHMDAAIKDLCS